MGFVPAAVPSQVHKRRFSRLETGDPEKKPVADRRGPRQSLVRAEAVQDDGSPVGTVGLDEAGGETRRYEVERITELRCRSLVFRGQRKRRGRRHLPGSGRGAIGLPQGEIQGEEKPVADHGELRRGGDKEGVGIWRSEGYHGEGPAGAAVGPPQFRPVVESEAKKSIVPFRSVKGERKGEVWRLSGATLVRLPGEPSLDQRNQPWASRASKSQRPPRTPNPENQPAPGWRSAATGWVPAAVPSLTQGWKP